MSEPLVLDVRGTLADAADLAPAIAHARAGGVLGYPTETVYGFGAACTPEGIARVRALKRRDEDRPLLVLVRDAETVAGLAWTEEARDLSRTFWPGAVTLILSDPDRLFPAGVRSGSGAVAVRVSPYPLVRTLVEALGTPITSTSANVPGAQPARSGEETLAAARALGAGAQVMVIDAGTLPHSGPSTLVDCTGAQPVVLREGSVPIHRLRCALPGIHGSA